ncbi:hypothetical protein N7510_002210 [Penicillium lagena]|uniref:uncharacterized protein n=1 Tax=Penicillium lagena TaxID=94218 RepID=UPI002541E543|nr:uncharacterized protein N7510_002210 [Penicillium lagena]KAJ5625901.1 hypothetical protein N7510_002210 [Penicillium lagena]
MSDWKLMLKRRRTRRWDSSDPDRAPPPLPLNPRSMSPITKSHISPNVQAIAAKFTDKPGENTISSYTTNSMSPKPPSSPERQLVKGNIHKRMQSQPGDARSEFLNYLDSRSPDRPQRATIAEPPAKTEDSKTTESPSQRPHSERDFSNYLLSSRYLSKPIFGESTPPSATMLALQNMQLPADTESPSPSTRPKMLAAPAPVAQEPQAHSMESISSQIHSLTDIASSLRHEMAQLSRRSKDNATDLVSLKAATNARDEDIRKSLRDLTSNLSSKFLDPDSARFDLNALLSSVDGMNSKELDSSPRQTKYSAPRMASPNRFASYDREMCGSPGPVSDGSASIALLEKVLREMATKEGEEKLLELVDEIKSRPAATPSDKVADKQITTMLEEILNLVKEVPSNRALIRSSTVADTSKLAPPDETMHDGLRSRSLGSMEPSTVHALDIAKGDKGERSGSNPDEILSILRSVKNSVIEGGGMTSGVKTLVRELRGEVLGMGRDLARRLEAIETTNEARDVGNEKELQPQALSSEEIATVVENSLQDLKEQLAATVNESREHSSALSQFQSMMNSAEIYSIVKKALDEFEPPQAAQNESRGVGLEKEEILDTVREAWETYKPEIELQNFGLERDEILECLTEGLKSYRPQNEQAVTYDQVLAAVQAGMQNFVPPPSDQQQQTITRDEIIWTIRECLEKPEPTASRGLDEDHLNSLRDEILAAVTGSVATQSMLSTKSLDSGLGHDEIVSAVSDGLEAHFAAAKEKDGTHITREDVVNAINDAFNSQQSALSIPTQSTVSREDIMNAIADGIEASHSISRDASQSFVSRDEILAAIAEGLEASSAARDSAVANIQPSVSREEILQTIAEGIETSNSITREIELNKDDLMEAITAGLHEATNSVNLNPSDQVLDRLQDLLDGMKEEFKQYSAANGKDTEQVLDAIKDGLHDVRRELDAYVVTATDVSGKHEIIDTVKEGFRLLQADMEKTITDATSSTAPKNPDTPELLDAMEKEFEHLRSTISTLLIQDKAPGDKDEIIDAIRDIAEQQRSVVHPEPGADKDEIIAALREHFEYLREETMQRRDGNESMLSSTSELLDAFNDGVDSIRDDLKKFLDKPFEFDMTEVLDTIKDGLVDLKTDMDSLRQSQSDDAGTTRGGELMLADSGVGSGIESLKALITELQGKVDAIETPRADEPTEDALKRGHLDELLVAIQEVQVVVAEMSNQHTEGLARKEDTDNIEGLIMSTKAQIDDMVFPSPDEIATSEQIGTLEAVIREAKDSIADLSTRIEADAPTKSDIGTLEGLIKDVWIALDELKGSTKGDEAAEQSDRLLKSDLQTVEAMIFEVKSQVDELRLPDVETLPTKADIQELSTIVTEFREKMEADNDLTGQGFEARKVEHGGLAEKIEEAKFLVGELGDELKSKLDGSSEGLAELKQLLEGLAVTAESFTTVENVRELTDLINREFERARGEQDAGKLDNEERDAAVMTKHDETRAAIIVELGAKIDEKIAEVMSKYDDAHESLHSRFSETEERDMTHTEALTDTKALAEDIKLVIGAMGTSVSESCERMSVDTKTFFEKVEESCNRMEDMSNEVKSHQEQARVESERMAATTERVESKLLEFHPQILESVQEILSIVSQHYDHSQKAVDESRSELSSTVMHALPPAGEDLEKSPLHDKLDDLLEHAKNNQVQEVLTTLLDHSRNDQLHEKLDRALEQGSGANGPVYDKLNELLDHATNGNGPVHEKLDMLLSHTANSESSVTQMMKLDEMHKDIMNTHRKMNEMFTAQSAMVAKENTRKRQEAEDAAIALERRVAQREQVEADIVGLNEEKDSLLSIISTLQAEKEDLIKQNTKLNKDLSGLETALEIRHEEMRTMEDRAEGLEKRILEGVLDHARSVLLSRSNSSVPNMSLKRNRTSHGTIRSSSGTSKTSYASTTKDSKDNRDLLGNGVGIALKRRVPASLQAGLAAVQPNIGKERRILSLSHVTGNRVADRQVSGNSSVTGLKRSHSVKSNFSLRKASWGGRTSLANKENESVLEEDELDSGGESDAETERRTSYTGTCTESVTATETESMVSATDRRTSGMSSTTGQVTVASSVVEESQSPISDASGSEYSRTESECDMHTAHEDQDPDDDVEEQDDRTASIHKRLLENAPPPSDSGLGTDISVA